MLRDFWRSLTAPVRDRAGTDGPKSGEPREPDSRRQLARREAASGYVTRRQENDPFKPLREAVRPHWDRFAAWMTPTRFWLLFGACWVFFIAVALIYWTLAPIALAVCVWLASVLFVRAGKSA